MRWFDIIGWPVVIFCIICLTILQFLIPKAWFTKILQKVK